MGRNYIVTRATPDWATFDLNDTRAFCAAINFPETLIIDFAARWDAALSLSFLQYREAMKAISMQMIREVRDASIVTAEEVPRLPVLPDDVLYFTDDDDWVRPDLFERLRAAEPSPHGWLWNSPAVAKIFGAPPPGMDGRLVVHERPLDGRIHTNNYAVSGAAWNRLGQDALFEHYRAQVAADRGEFAPVPVKESLTGAHKHMCCTLAIHRNSGLPEVYDDIRSALLAYQSHLSDAKLTSETRWLKAGISEVMVVNEIALATSCS